MSVTNTVHSVCAPPQTPHVLRLRSAALAAAPAELQPSESVMLPELRVQVKNDNTPFRASWLRWVIDLLESPYLNENEKNFVDEWLDQFNLHFPAYAGYPSEEASLALCMVLCRVIVPSLYDKELDSDSLEGLTKLDLAGRDLLEMTIPPGETVDSFVESYEKFLEKKALMQKILVRVDEIVKEKIDELYLQANTSSEEFRERYELIRNKLRLLNLDRQEIMDAIHQGLEQNSSFLEEYFSKIAIINTQMAELDQRMESAKAETTLLLTKCQEALKRIK